MMTELIKPILEFFQRSSPTTQAIVLVTLLAVLIVWIWISVHQRYRYLRVRADRDGLRGQLTEVRSNLTDVNARVGEMRTQVEQLHRESNDASARRSELEQEIEDRDEQLVETSTERDDLRRELDDLQRRFDSVRNLDSTIWERACRGEEPRFVPPGERTTRFVTFLNLKGGVGKTTLTANLGAAFATGIVGDPLRVLAVDLDFQGTLSNLCVSTEFLNDRRRKADTSGRLLDRSPGVLESLLTPMAGTDGRSQVVVAEENLENADFQQQARFVVTEDEVRFRHRETFHTEDVLDRFDLVFFDCPPRLTTSSINALFCSDYVVVPTALHPNDVDAVRRTLMWLRRLGALGEFRARLAGIVLNRTFRAGTTDAGPTNDEKVQLGLLRSHVAEYDSARPIFETLVPQKPEIARAAAGNEPLGSTRAGHGLYNEIAREVYQRVRS